MNDTSANPVFVVLLFILRCVVPLAILFGVSYLLRKMGLVAVESPEPPDDFGDGNEEVAKDVVAATKETTTSPDETVKEGLESSEPNPTKRPTVENTKESSQ